MKHSFRKIVAVKYDCKEYANRLWNDMSIFAAGLELNAQVVLPPRIEHIPYLRPCYELWAQFVGRILHPIDSIWAWGGTVKYLPPSEPLYSKYHSYKSLYLFGMLFRNPVGFKKFAHKIRARFAPSSRDRALIQSLLAPVKGRIRIGVHIRTRPYMYFPNGAFLLPPERTREIVAEFLGERGLSRTAVGLIVTSDGPLPSGLFIEYTWVSGIEKPELDFHLLASASVILGTNDSASNLAAWYANVPHVVTDANPIDWAYYRDRETFFDNKYATFTKQIPACVENGS